MSQVTVQEIVEALLDADTPKSVALAKYIEQHGIAPPDGMALVPDIATERIIDAIIERGNQHGDDISYDTAVLIWNDAIYAAAAPEVKS